MSPGAATPETYEVRCPRCRVSFPPETRRCLHCGAATVPPGAAEAAVRPSDEARQEPRPFSLERPGPPGTGGGEAEVDETEARAGRLSRGLGLLWILAVVGVSIYRACAGTPQP